MTTLINRQFGTIKASRTLEVVHPDLATLGFSLALLQGLDGFLENPPDDLLGIGHVGARDVLRLHLGWSQLHDGDVAKLDFSACLKGHARNGNGDRRNPIIF